MLCAHVACALDPQARFADYVRDNWNTESGLPQTSALSITQDDTGYIWIGTQNAIARFDGVRFTVFDRDSTGVDTTLASVAHTDKHGDVWFGTPHGALHLKNGRFELIHAGQDSAAIVDIGDSGDGSLLFATSLGVMRFDGSRIVPALLEGEACFSLLRQGATQWVGVAGALVRIDAQGIERFALPATANPARVTHIVADQHGLWLGTTAGLMKFAAGQVSAANYGGELDTRSIESLFRDSDGNLWIGTAPTLFRLRPDGHLRTHRPRRFHARFVGARHLRRPRTQSVDRQPDRKSVSAMERLGAPRFATRRAERSVRVEHRARSARTHAHRHQLRT